MINWKKREHPISDNKLVLQCLIKTDRIIYVLMKLISLNVGLPRQVNFRGEVVNTGIFKGPVQGRVKLRKLNLDGDRQADSTVHGR